MTERDTGETSKRRRGHLTHIPSLAEEVHCIYDVNRRVEGTAMFVGPGKCCVAVVSVFLTPAVVPKFYLTHLQVAPAWCAAT